MSHDITGDMNSCKNGVLYLVQLCSVPGLTSQSCGICLSFIQGGAKRTHVFEMGYLPAISFFGVTSNQKSAFENLV
jgi:hypothetical protein